MSDDGQWQLHGSAPELYERYLVPAITALWANDLLQRAALQPGERVLDLACGTGIVGRLAAARMGAGWIVGMDLNTGMLAVARAHSANGACAVQWLEGSALALPFRAESFDLVLCQLGLQFFSDQPLALKEMRRVLAPAGRVALSVFTAIEHTPAANALADALDRNVGAGASQTKRTEHGMSDQRELAELVSNAGFRNLTIETVTQIIRFPSAEEYVRLQLSATPMAALLEGMDGPRQQEKLAAITRDLITSLQLASDTDELTFPQEAYVLVATR